MALRELWPLVRTFGVSDDRAREEALNEASTEALAELVRRVDTDALKKIDAYLDETGDAEEAVPYGDLAQAAIEAATRLRDRRDADAPLIPVQFRELDDSGRVSLANAQTRTFMEQNGITLAEGLYVHLCQPEYSGDLNWQVANAHATYLPQTGRWMAGLDSPLIRASESPADHWSRRIPPELLGPLVGRLPAEEAARFSVPRVNVITSDAGFSVEVLGRTGLRYTENDRSASVDSEVLATPGAMALYQGSIKKWDSPHEAVALNDSDRERIVENIRSAFASQGYKLEVM
jgi:hypothetical protein